MSSYPPHKSLERQSIQTDWLITTAAMKCPQSGVWFVWVQSNQAVCELMYLYTLSLEFTWRSTYCIFTKMIKAATKGIENSTVTKKWQLLLRAHMRLCVCVCGQAALWWIDWIASEELRLTAVYGPLKNTLSSHCGRKGQVSSSVSSIRTLVSRTLDLKKKKDPWVNQTFIMKASVWWCSEAYKEILIHQIGSLFFRVKWTHISQQIKSLSQSRFQRFDNLFVFRKTIFVLLQ